mgnify:CR=1 FL=1
MPEYLVYKEGEKPWPDEVRWTDEAEMRERVQEAAAEYFRTLTPEELAKFANTHLGLVVDVKS